MRIYRQAMPEKKCETCRWYWGAGFCFIEREDECAEGGGFEAWEPKPNDTEGVNDNDQGGGA